MRTPTALLGAIGLAVLLSACGVPTAPETGTGAGSSEDDVTREKVVASALCPQELVETSFGDEPPWPQAFPTGFGVDSTCAAQSTLDTPQGEEPALVVLWDIGEDPVADLESVIQARLEEQGYERVNGEPSLWSKGDEFAELERDNQAAQDTNGLLRFLHTLE